MWSIYIVQFNEFGYMINLKKISKNYPENTLIENLVDNMTL